MDAKTNEELRDELLAAHAELLEAKERSDKAAANVDSAQIALADARTERAAASERFESAYMRAHEAMLAFPPEALRAKLCPE